MILGLLNRLGALSYRIKGGSWCRHNRWTEWYLVDLGRRKIRHCKGCHWMETT
jgi:hypothetical protein